MTAQVVCPHCGKSIKFRDRSLLGKKGKCPGCTKAFLLQEQKPDDEVVAMQLADEEPAVGTGAKWVPDAPVIPVSGQPTVAYVPVQTPQGVVLAPVVAGQFPAFPTGVAPLSPVPPAPPQPVTSPTEPAFAFDLDAAPSESTPSPTRTAYGSARSARKKKGNATVWIGVGVAAVVLAGAMVFLNSQSTPAPPGPSNATVAASTTPVATTGPATPPGAYSRETLTADTTLLAEFRPTKGEPIPLNMLTGSNNVLIHLRPDRIWGQERASAELKASLTEDVVKWLEATIERITRRKPDQIDELLIGISVVSKVEPPQISTVFRLKNPEKRSALILEFNGEEISPAGKPLVTRKDQYAFHVKDDRTIAICPAESALELSDAVAQPGECVTNGIQQLVKNSDRDRSFTIFFDVTDVTTYSSQLFEPSVESMFVKVLDWFGPEAETVSWSVNVGKTLHSEIRVRPMGARSGTGRVSTAESLRQDYSDRLTRTIELDLVSAVRMMRPNRSGFRQIIGRFPAMVEAFREASIYHPSASHLTVTTVLPPKAATNLALGTVLTWDESTRTNFTQSESTSPEAMASKDLPKTVMERLKTEFEIEFARKPLADAFAYLGEESKVTFIVDGDALKMAGYTKNMPQTFSLGKAPATKGIYTIITWPMQEKLCLVVDDAKMEARITTLADAESKGLKIVPAESLK